MGVRVEVSFRTGVGVRGKRRSSDRVKDRVSVCVRVEVKVGLHVEVRNKIRYWRLGLVEGKSKDWGKFYG